MTDENSRDLQIERYIHKRMSPSEAMLFEEEMESDVRLKADVEVQIEIKDNFNKPLLEFKSELDKAEKELEQEGFFEDAEYRGSDIKTSIRRNLKGIWTAAASVLIIASALLYFYTNQPDYEKLARNAALKDFQNSRGGYNTLHNLFADGKYDQLIAVANNVLNDSLSDEERDAIILITMRSHILLNDPQAVLGFIQSLEEKQRNNCGILYVAGLAYLQLQDRNTAVNYFNLIIKRNDCYPISRKTIELLNQIK